MKSAGLAGLIEGDISLLDVTTSAPGPAGRLPLTPERVWRALQERKAQAAAQGENAAKLRAGKIQPKSTRGNGAGRETGRVRKPRAGKSRARKPKTKA